MTLREWNGQTRPEIDADGFYVVPDMPPYVLTLFCHRRLRP